MPILDWVRFTSASRHLWRLRPLGGLNRLSDTLGERKSGNAKRGKSGDGKAGDKRGGRAGRANDVGRALRSVYDETLREDVPDDFLDLLGKLS